MRGPCGVDVGSLGGRCICGWKIYRINEEEEVNKKIEEGNKIEQGEG